MLNLIVALPEEARPVVHHYRLKRLHHVHAFPVYGNDDVRLIVSGIGNLAVAVATGYLAGIVDAGKTTAWLNVGIAGCKSLSLGEAVLAHKITNMVSQQIFYPAICFDAPCKTVDVRTVAVPESNYLDEAVYDMEAAGFYSAALRFSTSELIHSIKIISDNETLHIDNISGAGVVNLLEQRMDDIANVADKLLVMVAALDAENMSDEEIDFITSRFHFTVSQRLQFKTLMQHWFALTDMSPLAVLNIDALKTTNALLNSIQLKLSELPVKY